VSDEPQRQTTTFRQVFESLESGREADRANGTCPECKQPIRERSDSRVDRMIQALIVRGVTPEEYAQAWRAPHEVPCAVRRYTSEPSCDCGFAVASQAKGLTYCPVCMGRLST
jgi:hypothetical protein